MLKKCFSIFCAIIILLLSVVSCNKKIHYWEFNQDLSNVNEICIIETTYTNTGTDEITVLKTFNESEYEDILNKIKNIEMTSYLDLDTPSRIAIKIGFSNGEYDLISCVEPQHYLHDEKTGKIIATNSHLRCNKEQFNDLIDDLLRQGN